MGEVTHIRGSVYAGALAMRTGGDNDNWRTMDSAPRDGTFVELKCSYGVAPWYCVAQWTDECMAMGMDGERHPSKASEPSWQKPEGGGPYDENSLMWRPYSGSVDAYQDPTGGMQNDMAYWRGAVAAKHGLPPTHFENLAERNRRRNEGLPPSADDALPWIVIASLAALATIFALLHR